MAIGKVGGNVPYVPAKIQKVLQDQDYSQWSDEQLISKIKDTGANTNERLSCLGALNDRAKNGKTDLYADIFDTAKEGNSSFSQSWDDSSTFLTECIKVLANDNNKDRKTQLEYFRDQFGIWKADYPEEPRRYASIELAKIEFKEKVKTYPAKDVNAFLVTLKVKLNTIDDNLGFGNEYHPFILQSVSENDRAMSDEGFITIKQALFATGRIDSMDATRAQTMNAIAILQFDYEIDHGDDGNKIGHKTIESLLSEISTK